MIFKKIAFSILLIILYSTKSLLFSKSIETKIPEYSHNIDHDYTVPMNAHLKKFVDVLMGVGFTMDDAQKAINKLSEVYPLEILREHSYLILPSIEENIISFAVNINNSDAVIIKRNKNK